LLKSNAQYLILTHTQTRANHTKDSFPTKVDKDRNFASQKPLNSTAIPKDLAIWWWIWVVFYPFSFPHPHETIKSH